MNAPTITEPLTTRYTGLIAGSQPGTEAIAAARDGLLDFLACAFAGAHDAGTEKLWGVVSPTAGAGSARIIGREARTDAATAALVNGHAGHALDYDDVHASVRGHPSTVILPAVIAAAEESAATADAFLAAYVVGVEAMARLGLALGSKHYEAGFHATATLGTVGAAAAVAHLEGFDANRTAAALGIAATQSFGLRLQFGSEVKPLHAGLAARAGLFAARLAEADLTAAAGFLDGQESFLAAFGFGAQAPQRAVEAWGAPWQILSPGLIFKEFACCTATHCAAQATLDIKAADDPDPALIERITVTFPPGGDAPLIVSRPKTGVDGRFSVEYVVASILIEGGLGLETFSERPVSAEIDRLLARVEKRNDPAAPRMSSDPTTRFSVVDIWLTDGRRLSRRVGAVRGADNLETKFIDAAGARRRHIPALIRDMASREDLATLFAAIGA